MLDEGYCHHGLTKLRSSLLTSVWGMWGEGAFAGTEAAEWFSKFLEGEGFKMFLATKPRYMKTHARWGDVAQQQDRVICTTYT